MIILLTDIGTQLGGFLKVCTEDQSLDLPHDALQVAGVAAERIYSDQASGCNTERPELDSCLKVLRSGDSRSCGSWIVWGAPWAIWWVSSSIWNGAAFESLQEKIDTGSATGKLVFHLFANLAEFERNLSRERTIAGAGGSACKRMQAETHREEDPGGDQTGPG